MKKKLFVVFAVLLVLGGLVASYSFSIAKQPVSTDSTGTPDMSETPTSTESASLPAGTVATPESVRIRKLIISEDIPNTLQAQEIIRIVQMAYDIEVEGGRTFDLSKFSTVFVNDPRFNVPVNWLKVVRKATGNPTLEKAGYLEYKIAYYTIWGEDVRRSEARRLLQPPYTPEPSPTVPPGVTLVLVGPPPPFVFKSMSINGDVATVVVGGGAVTSELTLVLVNGQWYIAGENILSISP